jgi:hypothetical protein
MLQNTFIVEFMINENVLVKIQKPQVCYSPDGLLVKLSVF